MPKNRVEKEEDILSDVGQTEIVVITEEITAKMRDLGNEYTHEGIADRKQEEQVKPNREEAKSEQEGRENEDNKH